MKLIEFSDRYYPDEAFCERELRSIREKRGIVCSSCRHETGLHSHAQFQIAVVLLVHFDARVANAFPRNVKKRLADPLKSWILKKGDDNDSWNL